MPIKVDVPGMMVLHKKNGIMTDKAKLKRRLLRMATYIGDSVIHKMPNLRELRQSGCLESVEFHGGYEKILFELKNEGVLHHEFRLDTLELPFKYVREAMAEVKMIGKSGLWVTEPEPKNKSRNSPVELPVMAEGLMVEEQGALATGSGGPETRATRSDRPELTKVQKAAARRKARAKPETKQKPGIGRIDDPMEFHRLVVELLSGAKPDLQKLRDIKYRGYLPDASREEKDHGLLAQTVLDYVNFHGDEWLKLEMKLQRRYRQEREANPLGTAENIVSGAMERMGPDAVEFYRKQSQDNNGRLKKI